MHTLYENKNYVHKLFTNIYEKKLQSKNTKHKKSNKKKKACPNPRSGYRGYRIRLLLPYSSTAWAGWMFCFCVHVEKGNGKIKISIRWASTCDVRARRTSVIERHYGNQPSRVQVESAIPPQVYKIATARDSQFTGLRSVKRAAKNNSGNHNHGRKKIHFKMCFLT